MKKTNDVFETPSLEREEENLNYGAFGQPTLGRNVRANQFGFELPVTQINPLNPQFAYSNLPVNIPVVNQQQPYFGYNHPAFQPINLAGGYNQPSFQPVNLAGVATVNPAMGYAVQNPFVANQFGFQTGFAGNNVPVALTPVQVAGIPMQQPFLSNFHAQQPVSFYNPALGTVGNQEHLTNQPLGQANLQTQTIPVSYASGTTNGKKDFIGWIPEANILETDKTFRIELAVPGITRETCKVAIDKGILWVSGTRKVDETESKLVNITKKEFSYGSFYRSFLLTENLENEKIQVSCHHGLLTINIPKKELTKKLASEIAVN